MHNLPDKLVHTLKVPYKDDHLANSIKSIKTSTKESLPEKHGVRIILRGTKLSSQFSIKDKQHNKQHKQK